MRIPASTPIGSEDWIRQLLNNCATMPLARLLEESLKESFVDEVLSLSGGGPIGGGPP